MVIKVHSMLIKVLLYKIYSTYIPSTINTIFGPNEPSGLFCKFLQFQESILLLWEFYSFIDKTNTKFEFGYILMFTGLKVVFPYLIGL